mmetsp:Transcript_13346/g.15111  ORF Transcript_13346/g.15111 Transcript_13346/m.15111 type:complete len:129 (-) Transcript_13346:59-445(-)
MVSGMASSGDPETMLYLLRGRLMRRCAVATNVHYQGLAAAARALRHSMPSGLSKKLIEVDTAYNIVRHLDEVVCTELFQELEVALSGNFAPCPPAQPTIFDIFDPVLDQGVQTDHSMGPLDDCRLLRL